MLLVLCKKFQGIDHNTTYLHTYSCVYYIYINCISRGWSFKFAVSQSMSYLIFLTIPQHRENFERFCSQIGAGEGCYRIIGYIGVYRICLSLFTFHILMTFLTIAVSSSQTFRGKIHNGQFVYIVTYTCRYWFWKLFFIVSVWITAYFFPHLETLTRGLFDFYSL